jgi:hypothetical protein
MQHVLRNPKKLGELAPHLDPLGPFPAVVFDDKLTILGGKFQQTGVQAIEVDFVWPLGCVRSLRSFDITFPDRDAGSIGSSEVFQVHLGREPEYERRRPNVSRRVESARLQRDAIQRLVRELFRVVAFFAEEESDESAA